MYLSDCGGAWPSVSSTYPNIVDETLTLVLAYQSSSDIERRVVV